LSLLEISDAKHMTKGASSGDMDLADAFGDFGLNGHDPSDGTSSYGIFSSDLLQNWLSLV
jgi:hypothetical protein